MPNPSVRVSGEPWSPHIEVDGHDISKAVRSVAIRYEHGHRAEVVVELLADTVELQSFGSADVKTVLSMPSDVEDALTALGWTPPGACAGGC